MPKQMMLTCHVVRWVSDDPWPGWVEVQLTDADGLRWSLFDKPPIFAADDRLTPQAAYPVELALECDVLREGRRPDDSQRVVVVQMRRCYGVPTQPGQDPYPQHGEARFVVRADQLRSA